MNTLWWSVTLVLMFAGLAGTVLPLLPGTTIILAAAVLHHFTIRGGKSIGWWTISALVVLTLLSYVVDFGSSAIGAKKFGATRWGAIGGFVGAVVGVFFGLPGVFIGPLVGVLLGELLGGKGLLPAGRSTWGSFLGTTAGIVLRFVIGVVMIVWFLLAALYA